MDDFQRIISGYDADGIIHRFKISNMIMPGFSVWKAEEIEGGYQFEILVKPEENQAVAIEHLHQKILTGLGFKTLTQLPDRYLIDNAIKIDKVQHLKSPRIDLKRIKDIVGDKPNDKTLREIQVSLRLDLLREKESLEDGLLNLISMPYFK